MIALKLELKWKKKKVIFKNFILSILFFAILFVQNNSFLWNLAENKNNHFDNRVLLVAQGSGDDTTSPVITFIQPLKNNTRITASTYSITVNISDDNPPLNGSVTLRISNQTNLLFNAIMDHESENLWSYNWNNISAFPNWEEYIIQVWAKDSSLIENLGKSEVFYVYLSLSKAPGKLYMVLCFIAVSLIFAGTCVYLNKNIYLKKKKRERTKSLFDD